MLQNVSTYVYVSEQTSYKFRKMLLYEIKTNRKYFWN